MIYIYMYIYIYINNLDTFIKLMWIRMLYYLMKSVKLLVAVCSFAFCMYIQSLGYLSLISCSFLSGSRERNQLSHGNFPFFLVRDTAGDAAHVSALMEQMSALMEPPPPAAAAAAAAAAESSNFWSKSIFLYFIFIDITVMLNYSTLKHLLLYRHAVPFLFLLTGFFSQDNFLLTFTTFIFNW